MVQVAPKNVENINCDANHILGSKKKTLVCKTNSRNSKKKISLSSRNFINSFYGSTNGSTLTLLKSLWLSSISWNVCLVLQRSALDEFICFMDIHIKESYKNNHSPEN